MKEPQVNFHDPNLNIAMPVFSIHGNHDDISGLGDTAALELLSVAGLINYFGRCTDLREVQLSPVLLQKGRTRLALYGLGNIRDERLHRIFTGGKPTSATLKSIFAASQMPIQNTDYQRIASSSV
ncbi:Double-strand break repair protein mus-23 [Amphibalanus amphitrite]|uniref:Double-strand break repair protein mus-23 n=1 Tax=Amphibalanus amphitrite TaxID=1232801 RepID=A0A6A4W0D4_AMPAM|nr:Double-strand break repair protein mus-23 [Amphibalanus amphitrite]